MVKLHFEGCVSKYQAKTHAWSMLEPEWKVLVQKVFLREYDTQCDCWVVNASPLPEEWGILQN